MSNKIKTILDSIKEIEQVKLKPYFYSRLSSKLEKIYEKESFYLKYERPALVLSVVILLLLNLFFINNDFLEEDNTIYSLEEIYFDEQKKDIINFTSNEE
ncbi:MAG: hypothetical protein VX499_01180 [Bacteroidota bacterium]|jgi:hypothetical protein|nr:hypothetical protein [Bacteroidota bacterium]|tara:strand:- start:320 stop:619 length:300 start_codon:yes stop_codon:yes gene_type:complete